VETALLQTTLAVALALTVGDEAAPPHAPSGS